MTCLIADDNELALITLKNLVSQVPELELVSICRDSMEAFEYLKSNTVDLAILDVEMPGMTGVELIKALQNKPAVILSTANPQYAADAFDLDVVDYIIKPVSLPRLLKSVEKAKKFVKNDTRKQEDKPAPGTLFIKEKGVLKKLNLLDAYYVEAMGDYVKVHFEDKWEIVNSTVKDMEEKYGHIFIRTHRSYLAQLKKIEKIDDGAVYAGKFKVPLTESFRKKVIESLDLI